MYAPVLLLKVRVKGTDLWEIWTDAKAYIKKSYRYVIVQVLAGVLSMMIDGQ